FGEGQYRPNTMEGKRLLAHELTHATQQLSKGDLGVQRQPADKPEKETPGKLKPGDLSENFKRMLQLPEYIDNNIVEVNYFTAEEALIHYKDGSTFMLGLVPRWMKPPVVEVDYHTPAEDFHRFEDATTKRFGFMIKSEMADVPPNMRYEDIVKTYVHYVDFYAVPGDVKGTAHVIPSRINMLTAPTLCKVLLDSERRFVELTKDVAYMGEKTAKVLIWWAGMGGFSKGATAVGLGRGAAARLALSPTARTLAREMDALLATGGSKTLTVEGVKLADVTVLKTGSELAVSRSGIAAASPGMGAGTQVTRAFEEAAVELGRLNGAKTVTIDVGRIINPGWREIMEARGYVRTLTEEGINWIRTIKL
ncbi:MAG TPA: DUF4157 domain-containing protein, partial [Nitrososphaera sp.]